MLIASYLLGYDDEKVSHLAVDNVLPEKTLGFDFIIHPRASFQGQDINDLILLFTAADEPRKIICLPNLPATVVNHLLAGNGLQLIDFSSGRVIRLAFDVPSHQQRCA